MDVSDSGAGAVFEVFETRPPLNFVERVRAHIAATGMPETFPGLHPGPIGKDEHFRILGPISIPRHKREDGKMAPCPRCHCRDKFFEGQLVWFPELKAAAVVGHCCASAEQSNEANAEWREREARERAEEYLLKFLFDVPSLVRQARALAEPIAECQRIHDRFRKDGAQFQQALRKASRGGAQLHVTEEIGPALAGGPAGMRTSGSNVETRDVQFGRLAGQIVVATKCTLASDVQGLRGTLEGLNGHASDDDTALDFVTALSDAEKAAAAKSLSDAMVGLSSLKEALAEFRRFFTPANMDRITGWGSHPANATMMRASLIPYVHNPSKHLFELLAPSGRRLGILIEPVFWGQRPEAEAA
jgi:hypothetical protein